MIRGIYCANTALNAMEQKINTIADNLANVNTGGFKQEEISFKSFIAERYGVTPAARKIDFSMGSLIETGRELDFAINGEDAFFKVNTAQGDRYIRQGSFSCDESGYLVDKNGHKVAGLSGEVRMVNGKPDQDFYLATIANKADLIRTEAGFMVADPAGVVQINNVKVLQGQLEGANVDLAYNLTEMISTARNYALNSKIIMYQDEMLKKAADEIGSLK
jgi:flagellar basal-body rod protein FlgF